MKTLLLPVLFAFPKFVFAKEITLPIYTQSQKIAGGIFGVLGSHQLAPYLGSFYMSYILKAISMRVKGKQHSDRSFIRFLLPNLMRTVEIRNAMSKQTLITRILKLSL